MSLANSNIDLERKLENALAVRLKQQTALAKLRMRRTSEDSPKINQDLIISAKRGEGNPPFSGIYDMEVTCTFTMLHRKSVDTLPLFLRMCAAMEEVFSVGTYPLAAQLSLCAEFFYCYEIAVTGKDDTPEEKKHKCMWTLSAIAMSQSYANAAAIQVETIDPYNPPS